MRRRRATGRVSVDRAVTAGGVEGAAPSLQVSFRNALAFGPGKLRLLEEIDDTGSISASARRLDMSYKRAWDLASEMNAAFRAPLVVTYADGRRLGGAMLTDEGRHVMDLYRKIRAKALASVSDEFTAFCGLLADDIGADGAGG